MTAPSRRILAVKLADLGDLLTITPALRALRNGQPDARVTLLAAPSSAGLLSGSDLVDEIVAFDKFAYDDPKRAPLGLGHALQLARTLRGERFDALVLFHHLTTAWGRAKYAALALASGARTRAGLDNGHGWFLTHRAPDGGFGARHEVDYWLSVAALLGGRNPRPRLELPLTESHREWAGEQWAGLGLDPGRAAVVHPGSGAFSVARRWPVDRFRVLAQALVAELELGVVALSGPAPDERELAESVAAATPGAQTFGPAPSPLHLAAFLSKAALVVGGDSGVVHLAAAVERPIVAIFGPTNDRAWGPYPPDDPRFAVVAESLACRPCIHRGHSFGTPAGCPARTCLQLIEPLAVLESARLVLDRNGTVDRGRPPTIKV